MIAFSGDTGPNPAFARLACGADLLVHEASVRPDLPDEQLRGDHSRATDAARLAREGRRQTPAPGASRSGPQGGVPRRSARESPPVPSWHERVKRWCSHARQWPEAGRAPRARSRLKRRPAYAGHVLVLEFNRRPLAERVARIVKAHDVDIVAVAECDTGREEMEQVLRGSGVGTYGEAVTNAAKIRLFTRLDRRRLEEKFADTMGRMSIRELRIGTRPSVLLAIAHFPSKVNRTDADQALQATEFVREIARVEDYLGHRNTILMGDLNMNPFEYGVVGAQALHAVMTRRIAIPGERTVSGVPYPMFYNPMWGCFGDRTEGPPGTFYRSSSAPTNHFWNVYDQVLVRPGLIDGLGMVRILDSDGQEPLVSRSGYQPHPTTCLCCFR